MTITEINKTYNRIIGSLDALELKNAFDHIQGLMAGCRDYFAQDRLDELQNTYRYLLRYRMEGAKDPMQDQIYRDLRASAYELADAVRNRVLATESPLAYYSRRRILRNDASSFASLHESLSNWVAATREVRGGLEAQQNLERDLMTLFYKIWVADALNAEACEGIGRLLSDESLPVYVRCQVVAALTMALQAFFDKDKLALLFDAAEIEDHRLVLAVFDGEREDRLPVRGLAKLSCMDHDIFPPIFFCIFRRAPRKVTAASRLRGTRRIYGRPRGTRFLLRRVCPSPRHNPPPRFRKDRQGRCPRTRRRADGPRRL